MLTHSEIGIDLMISNGDLKGPVTFNVARLDWERMVQTHLANLNLASTLQSVFSAFPLSAQIWCLR